MESEESNGIYCLITRLCEKFAPDSFKVKNLRTKCYEILLKKNVTKIPQKYKNLSTEDPTCNLMAWQYALWNHYKKRHCAQQLLEYHEFLQESYENCANLDTYHKILTFLLPLREIPQMQDDNINLSHIPQMGFDVDFDKLFKLPNSILGEPLELDNSLFYFKPREKQIILDGLHEKKSCTCISDGTNSTTSLNNKVNEQDFLMDEERVDIWEIAAKEKYNDRKNWECYGYSEPDKEPIFLSELGDLSSLWTDNVYSVYIPKLLKNGTVLRPEVKCKWKFIRDLKYLLVGMASESFTYNIHGELILIPDITLEGITEESLEIFVKDFTLSGFCFKSLHEISYQNPYTNKYKCAGYIFEEFCESLNKYQQFYTTAIMSLSDHMNLLEFSEKTSHVRKQVITLASICRVGPYKESGEIPHGVDLLNYLYSKIAQIQDKKIILVLYSLLYPCCQVYYGRFILQWILDGSVNDPYSEFFIKTDSKFMATRGRTYWTRSFKICLDVIPDFLLELKDEIFLCGKMMNLLKLCHPFNKLSLFLMGKKPHIISYCITRNQLIALEQNAQTYYIEASGVCGPKISLEFILRKEKELNGDLLNLISKKRAATLKRIELERQKIAQESHEKKLEERTMLKEQYDIALQQKQFKILEEIENEIELIETNIRIELKNEKLVQEEAKDLIAYYEQLFQISDARREQIEKRIEVLKNCHLDSNIKQQQQQQQFPENIRTENIEVIEDSAPKPEIKIGNTVQNEETQIVVSSKSLDKLNANCAELEDSESNDNDNKTESTLKNNNFKETYDNFAQAKRNKMRVLNEELGLTTSQEKHEIQSKTFATTDHLTAAQKNKMKVMSSEFDIEFPATRERVDKEITISDINKFRMMTSTIFYAESANKNTNSIETDNVMETINENKIKSRSLSLNFNSTKENSETVEKCLPMSVDSTPLSENASTNSTTSKIHLGNNKIDCGSFPTTSEMTDDCEFKFENYEAASSTETPSDKTQKFIFSKKFPSEDVKNIEPMCLKMFLRESLSHSLKIQSSLVGNELLKYFVCDLKFLDHLKNLKNYFFLQDGEFGNSLTESLFNKLYNAKLPIDLLNFRVLSYLLHGALEDTKKTDNFDILSFKINTLPEILNLGDVDVLNCLSLAYEVEWPLNILLSSDTMAKYNDVFKFLLKINRMNWILKRIFSNLRMFAKKTGKKEQYLMMSLHFRKIQQFRYFMLHFVQVFQNYIIGEVLQSQWVIFEKNLSTVRNLDEIYDAHTQYIKNILFMCLLNQRSAPLKKVFDNIFLVILKFYDHLRSKRWRCENGSFVHPNFDKLQCIFDNFNELVAYLFKLGGKVVNNGYQPQFKYFLDSLNSNNFYLK